MKTAAIFDPYLDTLGGGEVYTSTVISCLLKSGYKVHLFWYKKSIKKRIKKFLGIDISKTKIINKGFKLFTKPGNILDKIKLTKQYDVIFYLSDGSIPFLFSKNNILHFQTPYNRINGSSLVNRVKLMSIHHVICNSKFTKSVIDKEFKVNSNVVYPPININPKPTKKENVILSVGRFTQTLHNKRQDILVKVFIDMLNDGLTGWKLHLVGNAIEKEGKEIVNQLKRKAKGYPIEIMTGIDHLKLVNEYEKAKIFWHAAGFGIEQDKYPEKVEHFGIATVEAMSAGCVPIVIDKGGQVEIINEGVNGFLWNSKRELHRKTLKLIGNDNLLKKISRFNFNHQEQFSKFKFCKNFISLLN